MIEFRCPNCSQKITTRAERAGTAGRCPQCKTGIMVPGAAEPESPNGTAPEGLTLIDPLPPRKAQEMAPSERERLESECDAAVHQSDKALLTSLGIAQLPEYTGQRKHVWPVDILLYPTSGSGLCVLAIVVGIPFVLRLMQELAGERLHAISHIFALAALVIGLYAMWYLAECIYDSARGGTRAPEITSQTTDWRAMFSRVVYLSAVGAVFVLPSQLYPMFVERHDAIYWVLFAWGIVFFPMGLLAMVIFDSESALNPFFLIGAIVCTWREYIWVVVLFGLATTPLWLPSWDSPDSPPPFWLDGIGEAVATYGAFVLAHILGRFYWRHREQLDWGI